MQKSKAEGIYHTIATPVFFGDKDLIEMPFYIAKKLYFESFRIARQAGCKSILCAPILFDVTEERVKLRAKQKKNKGMDFSKKEELRLKELEHRRPSVQEAKSFYLSLIPYARENNLKVLIPNNYDYYNGTIYRNALSDPYRLKEFVEELNKEAGYDLFKIALDFGICNLLGQNYHQVLSVLGNLIELIMLKENNGHNGASLMPFSSALGGKSSVDWLSIIRGLREIKYDKAVYIDYMDTYNAAPVSLRSDIVAYGKKIADYFSWQISMELVIAKYPSRVLFGAGNMCRNYMKCYGEEFPPLFTCDNNKAIWGQTFEGIEIKSPEALKELPDDTAIFLCNMYYDEITDQLRSMGLKNPIERYNDEYLPSMYTDRFDSEKREIKKEN
ncbi:hypothetical protein [Pseudobutyrivibrio sp. MD2005]|uniref:hypothetical protein n=1 Tax=Pseudobutyrivibrio sp. MD2005 TaxID=1410616 RepID=UPI0012DD410E|nr:hypothetical protein [Pseudobutyrivibrio sp. MD2005]